ncbi:glycosyltransferase family 61 protein [Cognataquiflexum rubidum]|uniref:glycosyltransferase family 61 protein n=1 Tax=Cognataquiflexum rubidum TaxID=2922273 RepID=UPI001F143E1C|nr:glycosyltransferase family 61 protein [Cognataquiflexum rubidum]MCH6234325.1 glycosyltransferase family 61 protein [Cognataquiflexum rubidum]
MSLRLLKSIIKRNLGDGGTKSVKNKINYSLIFFYKTLLKFDRYELANIIRFTRKRLHFLDEEESLFEFKKGCKSKISEPYYYGYNPKIKSIYSPDISLFVLKNSIFSIESSNFLTDDKLIVERIPRINIDIANYATGLIKYHNHVNGLVKLPKSIKDLEINEAYFLGGNGSFNYYHWMTEILPKMEFIATNKGIEFSKNIIVSEGVKKVDSFQISLELSCKHYNFNIIYINPKLYFRIKNLLIINKPSDILFNSKNILSDLSFCFYNKQSLSYVKSLLQNLKNDKINLDSIDKVFLGRIEGSARSYNQSEVKKMLETEFNFKTIYLENYLLKEQIFIFNNAKIIVGPSGASWTNLIFCNSNCNLISWLPSNIRSFSAFSSIASNFDLNMEFIEAIPDKINNLHTSYKIKLDDLRDLLQRL